MKIFSLGILGYLIVSAAGLIYVARMFGLEGAMVLSLIPALPLIVAVRLHHRWPAVRGTELILLVIFAVIASGGGILVVRDWFNKGMDVRHAEDMKWAEFGRLLRGNPAFKNVEIKKSLRKDIHWVSGTIASDADLDRLRSLATGCGISRSSLNGPYQHSVSLIVKGSHMVEIE